MTDTVYLPVPADMHAHFREGKILEAVVPITARSFDIALAMPNLDPTITTIGHLRSYRSTVLEAAHAVNPDFRLLATIYLTGELPHSFLEGAWQNEDEFGRFAYGVKWYPKGGTTNSDEGVSDWHTVARTFETMQDIGMPLLVHGEVVEWKGEEVAHADREAIFMEEVLPGIQQEFPELKMTLEHASTEAAVTAAAVDYKKRRQEGKPIRLAASITPQHARNTVIDLMRRKFLVHGVCMPILKPAKDRDAVNAAMVSGKPCFFAGTDSAPHLASLKEAACCAFGAFTAPAAVELYADAFELDDTPLTERHEQFARFMSFNGPEFYGLEPSPAVMELVRKPAALPRPIMLEGGDTLVPFASERAGFVSMLPWRIDGIARGG